MSDHVYTSKVRAKLEKLEAAKHRAELRARKIAQRIEELIAGQSPIRAGAVITWEGSNRILRGRVVSVRTSYRGFEYRVNILTKSGKAIGMATVTEDKFPGLTTS